MWSLEWGDQIETLEQFKRQTGRIAKPMQDRPILPDHLAIYIDAFWSLCADRGAGPDTPIRWTALSEYARRFGIDDSDEFKRFGDIIVALDAVWLKDQSKRARERAELQDRRQKAWG